VIHPNLYRKPATLESQAHRDLRIAQTKDDWSVAAGLNTMFIAPMEFADVALEYPIVFVKAVDEQGAQQVLPAAAFGLTQGENLYVEGATWTANYIPAMLRLYPFGIAGIADERVIIAIDEAWEGWSRTEGERVLDDQGQPTEKTRNMMDQIGRVAVEVQRGLQFGQLLQDTGLLMETRFEADLANGEKISVDGFLSVDADKLGALTDQQVLEFYRNGVMALIHAHQISMRQMARLAEKRLRRRAAEAAR